MLYVVPDSTLGYCMCYLILYWVTVCGTCFYIRILYVLPDYILGYCMCYLILY